MTFVDTNVFIYHVGGAHSFRSPARDFIARSLERDEPLVTSAEVLQEILHVYMRTSKEAHLADALSLVERTVTDVWSVEKDDVVLARDLSVQHPELQARDLVHLASCLRRRVRGIMTFDRALSAAWNRRR